MKIVLFVILLIPGIVFAQFEKSQKVILLDNPNAQEWVGSIKQLVDFYEEQHAQLMGQVKMSSLKGSKNTLVQIVWTGLSSTLDPKIQVVFEKPMISVFKMNSSKLKKDQQVPIDGDPIALLEALERLHAGKVDKNALKKRKAAHNPKTNGRQVLTEDSEGFGSENGQSNANSKGAKSGADDSKANNANQKQNSRTNPAGAMGKSGSQNTGSSFGDSNGTAQNSGQGGPGSARNGSSGVGSAFGSGNTTPIGSRNLPHGIGGHSNASSAGGSPFGMEDAVPTPAAIPDEEVEEPEMTHDVTEEGCRPRVDRVHERVIIQNRCKRLSNGVVQDEGECADSLEMYPIMKDFLCENCTDEVNTAERKAYSRYQEYWYDREGNKNNIGESVYIDASRPYPFIDEPSACAPHVDLESGIASRQVETVYYNFNNTRKMVEECHAPQNTPRIPLIQTTAGCKWVHDFAGNVSFEQKRSIFTIDGVEHEALQCHQVEPAIQHEWVETGCRPFVDLSTGSVTRMVRRKIRTSIGSKFITDECEPGERTLLNATREGCEGDYVHDFERSCSYLKKRYFFPQGTGRKYVTPCIRSDEFLRHQTEINGYQNNDVLRTAIPKLALYIDGAEGRLTVDPAKIRGTTGEIPYTFEKNDIRATGQSYFEGCFRRIRTVLIQIYDRPDGTKYEYNAGPSTPIVMQASECRRRTESREAVVGHEGGSFWKHGRDILGTQRRTITTYPDGREEAGPWY